MHEAQSLVQRLDVLSSVINSHSKTLPELRSLIIDSFHIDTKRIFVQLSNRPEGLFLDINAGKANAYRIRIPLQSMAEVM